MENHWSQTVFQAYLVSFILYFLPFYVEPWGMGKVMERIELIKLSLKNRTQITEKLKYCQSLPKAQPSSLKVFFDIAEGFILITFNKIQSKDDCLGSLSNKVLSLITILYYQ